MVAVLFFRGDGVSHLPCFSAFEVLPVPLALRARCFLSPIPVFFSSLFFSFSLRSIRSLEVAGQEGGVNP